MAEALAHYALLEHVGTGGLGDLYRARDTRQGRTAGVKVVRPELLPDAAAQQAFIESVNALRDLSHPNIASLYDVGEDTGRFFLAVEWVKGEQLRSLVAGHPLKVRRAVSFGAELSNALADAHARDQLHGDITSDTILITPTEHAKLLDFGLSAWTRGGELRRRATAGQAGGDEATRAGRRVRGTGAGRQRRTDPGGRAILDGRRAVRDADGPAAVRRRVRGPSAPAGRAQAAAPPPSQLNSHVSEELDSIVARALAPDPEARCQSAAALAAELRSVGAILEIREGDREPPTAVRRVRRSRARRRRWPAVIAVLAALAVGGALWGSC